MAYDNTMLYGGYLILILAALYMARDVFHPIAGAKKIYAIMMDSLGGAAFNTYVTPDNFHRD